MASPVALSLTIVRLDPPLLPGDGAALRFPMLTSMQAPTAPAIHVPGYQLGEQLHAGPRTLVYRALDQAEQRSVVIKLMRPDFPSFSELIQFRNQYAIAKQLTIPGVVPPHCLLPWKNGYALVMADWGGLSLRDYIRDHPLSVEHILDIAIQVTEILHDLAQHRVVHKDIKPANILIDPESLTVRLIDFSIASLLPRESQALLSPNVLEGTLAYLAPEQTGRMNRGIDYRTDFYGLGATLYELLTGDVPFRAIDPMELIHCHIAKPPPPLEDMNPTVPQGLSAVVLKLMAKNAEDRYQSALGLKHDLQQCLAQWQATSTVDSFPLGERDICDRFLVPEKLYGRTTEVQALLDAFERVAENQSELLLVAGFSGIGKTAVVNEVHKPITRQHGYFIKGKFDQLNHSIPLSGFVQALRDLIGQLLTESDTRLDQWKTKILTALGVSGQVLIEVIPELEQVIGPQLPVPELSGTAAQNRFNRLLQAFIAVFTVPEHPLVLFLDDLQWADSASIQLLRLLMEGNQALLLLGAYRDNEVSPIHPLMLTVAELLQAEQRVTTITLAPLNQDDTNQLVAETLKCSPARSHPLTELILRKTRGNPFFTTQFLKVLHQQGHLTFNYGQGHWECDISTITALAITDDVVEFMVQQLRQLPAQTQTVLKLAACIGNQFDLATLATVSERTEADTAAALWTALLAGLILPQGDVYKFYLSPDDWEHQPNSGENATYRFLHDRVQQAAYTLIPPQDRQTTHYRIGQLLLHTIPAAAREEHIFAIIHQLNHGLALVTAPEERENLARLNLLAAHKGRVATAYATALEYVQVGLSLLREQAWHEQYDLCLDLHNLAADLALLAGDLASMEHFIASVITHAHQLQAKVPVYRLRILSRVSQHEFVEAIDLGCQLLAEMGVEFPMEPQPADIGAAIESVGTQLGNRTIAELIDLPLMTDPQSLAIAEIANSIIPAAFMCGSPLFPLLVTHVVQLSIQAGQNLVSASAYVAYGVLAATQLQDIDTAVKFGQLAIQVIAKLEAKTFKPEVFMVVGLFMAHRLSHLKASLPYFKDGYIAALEVGNLDYVGYNAQNLCQSSFWSAELLDTFAAIAQQYAQELKQANQINTESYVRIYWQTSLCLLGKAEQPTILTGQAIDELDVLPRLIASQDFMGVYIFHLYKMFLCYLFEDLDAAHQQTHEARKYLPVMVGSFCEPLFYYYDALITLAGTQDGSGLSPDLKQRVEHNHTQLQQHWASYAPMNHQHKVDLVAAEDARAHGQYVVALERYDQAISGAKVNGYLQDEALANELAAKCFLEWQKPQVAAGYLQEAYYCYARWGAKAKITQLEQHYPQLLGPILQTAAPAISSQVTVSPFMSYQQHHSHSLHASAWLDFPAILKAAQTIAQEIELEKVLQMLMKIAIANAGAQTGHLILNQNNQWMIVAQAVPHQATLCNISLEECQDLPQNLIYSVAHTQATAVYDHLSLVPEFASHPYVLANRPKSALCMPISQQGNLVGILYLENNLTVGAFTAEHLEILQLLTSQAAISLENARLYQQIENHSRNLETEVQRKTQDLEQALHQLQHSNQKLERATRLKDEFLANMSHELRTPLNAILGMTEGLQEQVFGDINTKQHDILTTIERSGTHLLELINDILDVAKIESGQIELDLVPTALPPLCQSSLAFIKQQAHQKRIHLETKLPSQLPPVLIDERRIRQVLINLLNNAVKFTPDRGTITLEVSYPDATPPAPSSQAFLRVAIIDTGIGIAAEHLERLFQPFIQIDSALNRQYAGTGLGLSLVKRIVELHGGQVGVTSEVGVGSCFSFELPYTTEPIAEPVAAPPSSDPAAPSLPAQVSPPLILIAEDNEANISTLSCYLEAKGYRMVLARDGQEAVNLVQTGELPDLILMDIQMPGMDGIEAMQRIRQLPTLAAVPIIALTALAMRGDRERCLAAGANEYLSKPVKLKQLAATMQQLMEG